MYTDLIKCQIYPKCDYTIGNPDSFRHNDIARMLWRLARLENFTANFCSKNFYLAQSQQIILLFLPLIFTMYRVSIFYYTFDDDHICGCFSKNTKSKCHSTLKWFMLLINVYVQNIHGSLTHTYEKIFPVESFKYSEYNG